MHPSVARALAIADTTIYNSPAQALLRGTSKDSEACRVAARDALAAIPLSADTLLPLLAITGGGAAAAAPAKKRGAAKKAAEGAAHLDGEPLEQASSPSSLLSCFRK